MKKYCLFLIFLLVVPITFADITIQTDHDIYNLGNKLKASASVLQDKEFEGLFKMTILCGAYSLQYFTTPVSLETNSRTALDVPDLTLTPQMLGNCSLTGNLATNENLMVEQKQSNNFEVTNQLNVLPINNIITALPGESIQVVGVVNEAYGNNVLKASTKIVLDEIAYPMEAIDGKFSLSIPLPKNVKSGKHTIEISASDSKNNLGHSSLGLEVTAVPSYIKTELSQYQILPGTRINITTSVYDQADELINASLDLELESPNKNNVFTKIVGSNEKIDYEFSQYAEPGIYVTTSSYKRLIAQSFINVSAVRQVKLKYDNEDVSIENVGNVPFVDQLSFFLQNELKKYEITKKISVEPGKLISIDLSKEVPSGVYNILLPLKEGLVPIKKTINETFSHLVSGNGDVLAEEVPIHDNRPIYKKIATGLDSISANLVGADGLLTKNPLVGPSILAAILLLLVFRYGRKPIMRLIKRKKMPENNENAK